MNINESYNKYLKISIINIFVLMICFISNFNNVAKYIIYITVLSIYYMFLLSLKEETEIVLYQILMFLLSTFVLDLTFHYLKITTPLELKYITEGISLILIFRIIIKRKKYNYVLKDLFIMIIIFIIIFNLWITIIKGNSLVSLFNTFRIYFRYIPIYIVLSSQKIELKPLYKIIYIFSFLAFSIQCLIGVNQDLRSGIFGIVGLSTYEIIIMIYYFNTLVKFLYKKVKLIKFLEVLIITGLILALAESKTTMVIFIIISVITTIIINVKITKKIISFLLLLIMLINGWNLMLKIYPKFSYLGDSRKFLEYAQEYIFGNSNEKQFRMGRFEAAKYVSSIEKVGSVDRYFGIGLGQASAPENLFYLNDANGRQEVIDFPNSRIFEKYGSRLGYHLSFLGILFIEGGYLGIVIVVTILMLFIIRSIKLLRRSNDIEIKALAAIVLYISLSSIFTSGYGNSISNRYYLFVVCVILGVFQEKYNNRKART